MVDYSIKKQRKTTHGTDQYQPFDVKKYFHLTLFEASLRSGLSKAELQRKCRCLGFRQWPSRSRKCIENYHEDGAIIDVTYQARDDILMVVNRKDCDSNEKIAIQNLIN